MIVLRDGADSVEALFMLRAPELRFMADTWVFPGGALSADDGEHADERSWRIAGVRETLEEAGLVLEGPDSLVPFSRWITPELVPMRFDTRFYLARAPEDAEPQPDGREMVRAEWWTPAHALQLAAEGAAQISFPTLKQLEQLAAPATVSEAFAAQHGRTIEPILPRVAASEDGFEILLPGEPGYDELS